MEVREQVVKSVQIQQWKHQNDVTDLVLVSLLLTLNRSVVYIMTLDK